jgi:hypothetical protein
MTEWVNPPRAEILDHGVVVQGTSATVGDFWAWALSDLRANTARGLLAEYLVALAVGAPVRPRVEWDECDVRIPEGRIEVKSAAYVQAWAQSKPSRISFGGLKARTWSPQSGYTTDRGYNADVYVFALLAAADHDGYDALDTSGWTFWVVPARVVRATGLASMSLSRVQVLAGESVAYRALGSEIRAALSSASGEGPG